MAKIIDGKGMAERIKKEVAAEVEKFKAREGYPPRLVVVLVGEDPASIVYVRNKEKDAKEVGISSEIRRISPSIKEKELIELIEELNADKEVHGILVQLPLPKGINENKVINAISPEKDVDGLSTENMGRLLKGEGAIHLPCTPSGVVEMILSTGVEIKGKEAVIVGRSNIVGKPAALLLLQNHATVTICHSRTNNLGEVVKRGDIVIAAVGRPKMITGEMIKDGAIVIDVGINRGDKKLIGDVDFESAEKKAAYISPVPGGVGPMTRAMLMKNALRAAEVLSTKDPK